MTSLGGLNFQQWQFYNQTAEKAKQRVMQLTDMAQNHPPRTRASVRGMAFISGFA